MSISKVFFKTRVKGVSNFGLCRFVYDRDPLSNMTVRDTKEKQGKENLGQKDFQIIYQSETNFVVKILFSKIIHHLDRAVRKMLVRSLYWNENRRLR